MKFPRITRRITMLLAASALLLGIPAAATASASSATTGTGWIRLAHLSPNTPAVDVYLYSFGNSNAQIVLHHVAYGTVSPYEAVTAGDYSVAMRASGASPSSQPVLSTSVTVKADHAYTVAGMGPESGLRLQVLDDNLTTPAGKSLVRVIQASLKQQVVKFHCSCGGGHRAQGVVRLRESLRGHSRRAPGPCRRSSGAPRRRAARLARRGHRPHDGGPRRDQRPRDRQPGGRGRGRQAARRAGSRPGSAAPRGTVRDRRCRGWRSSGPAR